MESDEDCDPFTAVIVAAAMIEAEGHCTRSSGGDLVVKIRRTVIS